MHASPVQRHARRAGTGSGPLVERPLVWSNLVVYIFGAGPGIMLWMFFADNGLHKDAGAITTLVTLTLISLLVIAAFHRWDALIVDEECLLVRDMSPPLRQQVPRGAVARITREWGGRAFAWGADDVQPLVRMRPIWSAAQLERVAAELGVPFEDRFVVLWPRWLWPRRRSSRSAPPG